MTLKVGTKVIGHPERGLNHRKGVVGVILGYESSNSYPMYRVRWEGLMRDDVFVHQPSEQYAEESELLLSEEHKPKGISVFIKRVEKEYSK